MDCNFEWETGFRGHKEVEVHHQCIYQETHIEKGINHRCKCGQSKIDWDWFGKQEPVLVSTRPRMVI